MILFIDPVKTPHTHTHTHTHTQTDTQNLLELMNSVKLQKTKLTYKNPLLSIH